MSGAESEMQFCEQAQAQMSDGDYSEALRLLSFAFEVDVSDKATYELASECLAKLGATEKSVLFNKVIADFTNAEAFYDLGYHFVDAGS